MTELLSSSNSTLSYFVGLDSVKVASGLHLRELHRALVFLGLAFFFLLPALSLVLALLAAALLHLQALVLAVLLLSLPPPPPRVAIIAIAAMVPPLGGPQSALGIHGLVRKFVQARCWAVGLL